MSLKLEPATVEELDELFGGPATGNDPETVKFIRSLPIGGGFKVTPENGETSRQVKRRINACAKDAFRELVWHEKEGAATLSARVKSIDVDAEKKALEEAEAANKAEADRKEKEEEEKAKQPPKPDEKPAETPTKTPETPPATGTPQNAPRTPVAAGNRAGG